MARFLARFRCRLLALPVSQTLAESAEWSQVGGSWRLQSTRAISLPCRRPWVRVPSSACFGGQRSLQICGFQEVKDAYRGSFSQVLSETRRRPTFCFHLEERLVLGSMDAPCRPPPYHESLAATSGNPQQRIWLVFAALAKGRFAADCHGRAQSRVRTVGMERLWRPAGATASADRSSQ